MSNGVTHSIYTAAVCGLDLQIGNVGERHGRAEGQQSRICWLDESQDGWMVGWSVGRLVGCKHTWKRRGVGVFLHMAGWEEAFYIHSCNCI